VKNLLPSSYLVYKCVTYATWVLNNLTVLSRQMFVISQFLIIWDYPKAHQRLPAHYVTKIKQLHTYALIGEHYWLS